MKLTPAQYAAITNQSPTPTPKPRRGRKGDVPTEGRGPLLVHMLHIAGWTPYTVNQLLAKGRWAWTLKKKDRERIANHVARVGIPPATGKRRVTLTITLGPRQRAADVDAFWKSLLDALKHAEMLIDDNRQWCEVAPVLFQRGDEKATTVVLEDVP